MALSIPERVFYSLKDIEFLWGVSSSEVSQWLMHGDLNASVWLPLMSLYRVTEKLEENRIIEEKELCHKEGYMKVCRHDCRNLFRYGKTELRTFASGRGQHSYVMPKNGLGFFVKASELIILEEERQRFEQGYEGLVRRQDLREVGLKCVSRSQNFDATFKTVFYEGKYYQFGDIQAAVLQKLYETASSQNPWANGKRLLAEVGSQSLHVANVFKRRVWKELITSDGRGRYRLNEAFLASIYQLNH